MRRALYVALLAVSASASAQNVITVRTPTTQTSVLPGARLTVPVVIDMSAAGGQNIAALTVDVSWNSSVIAFDSVRAAGFGTFSANTGNAASGSATLDVTSGSGTTATVTMANLYFTAAASASGSLVALTPTAASAPGGSSILSLLAFRDLGVCSEAFGTWGDGNGDANVNIIDAQQIARFSVGLSVANAPSVLALADVNADNSVNIIDAQQVARFSVGLSAAVRVNTTLANVYTPASVPITPFSTSLSVGQQLRLAAIPKNAQNTSLLGCAPVAWSSSSPSVATITSSGLLLGVSAGTSTITASSGGAQATQSIVVGASSTSWSGSISSSWTAAGNWTNGVPVASSSVSIPAGTPNTPVITSPVSVQGIVVLSGGALDVTSTTLTTSQSVVNLGTFSATSATLNTAVDNQGLFRALGNVALTGTVTTATASTLRVLTTTAAGGATLTVANGFTNVGIIEVTDSATFCCFGANLIVTNGTLTNASNGTIATPQGRQPSGRNLAASLDNQGLLSVSTTGGLTLGKSGAAHINSGTITLASGSLSVTQNSFTNSGTLTMSGGDASFTQSGGGASTSMGGTINFGANRTLTISGGLLDVTGGTFSTGGTLATNGVTITLPAIPAALYTNVALSFGNTTVAGGTLTVPSGQTLTFVTGTSLQSPIDNQGTLRILGAASLNAPLTTNPGSTLRVMGSFGYGAGTFTVANGFTNVGTIELADSAGVCCFGASLLVTSGTLTNASNGTIATPQGRQASGRTLAVSLDNQGQLDVSTTGGLALGRSGALHTNSGTITLTSGSLSVTQNSFTNFGTLTMSGGNASFTQSGAGASTSMGGTINFGANRTLTISGGLLDVTGGTFSTGGTLATNGVTITLPAIPAALYTNVALSLGNTTVAGGTLTVPSGQTVTFVTGTSLQSPIDNQGTLRILGSASLNAALTTNPGSTLRVMASFGYGAGTFTVANGFTNVGTIELADSASVCCFGASLVVTSGTLTNASSGTISTPQGMQASGRSLQALLDNQGQIGVNTTGGLTLGRAGAALANSGTIALTSGGLSVSQNTFNNSGTLTLSGGNASFTQGGAGAAMSLNGIVTIGASRTLTVSGGALDVTGGTLSGGGTLATNGVTITLPAIPAAFYNNVVLSLGTTTVAGGTLAVPSGQTLTLVTGTSLQSPIDNQGTLRILGSVSLNAALTTNPGSIVRVLATSGFSGGSLTVANGFTNAGTIELADSATFCCFGSALTVTSGTLINASGGTIATPQGAQPSGRILSASLNNQGALAVNTTGGLALGKSGAVHVNGGTVAMNTGSLTVTQNSWSNTASGSLALTGGNFSATQSGGGANFTNAGTITIGSAQTFTVSGGTLDISSGTLSGSGTIATTGSGTTVALPALPSLTGFGLRLGAATIAGGTLTIPNGQTLTLSNNTSLQSPVDNQGLLRTLGTVDFNAGLTTNAGSTVRVLATNQFGGGNFTVANGFTNGGTLELTDSASVCCFGAIVTVTNSPLVNSSTGIIATPQGAQPSGRTLAAALDNQGALTVNNSAGLALGRTGAAHTNSGTIALLSGGLTLTGASFVNSAPSGSISGPGTLSASGLPFTNSGVLSTSASNAAALMTFTGNYAQSGVGSSLNMKLGGTTVGTQYDKLAISGSATFGGTLNVTTFNGWNPAGNSYTILTYSGAPIGAFTLNLPSGCTANPQPGSLVINC